MGLTLRVSKSFELTSTNVHNTSLLVLQLLRKLNEYHVNLRLERMVFAKFYFAEAFFAILR